MIYTATMLGGYLLQLRGDHQFEQDQYYQNLGHDELRLRASSIIEEQFPRGSTRRISIQDNNIKKSPS